MQLDFVILTDAFWLLMLEEWLTFWSGLPALKLTLSMRKPACKLRVVSNVLKQNV